MMAAVSGREAHVLARTGGSAPQPDATAATTTAREATSVRLLAGAPLRGSQIRGDAPRIGRVALVVPIMHTVAKGTCRGGARQTKKSVVHRRCHSPSAPPSFCQSIDATPPLKPHALIRKHPRGSGGVKPSDGAAEIAGCRCLRTASRHSGKGTVAALGNSIDAVAILIVDEASRFAHLTRISSHFPVYTTGPRSRVSPAMKLVPVRRSHSPGKPVNHVGSKS